MSVRAQRVDLDQNHNIDKDVGVITNKNGNNNNSYSISNNNSSVERYRENIPAAETRNPAASSAAGDNNMFRQDIISYDTMPSLPMSMSTEDMANMPMSMGVQEFLMPMEAFFFSGLQCFESITGGSTVAIDNKIEQAMDLVKRHLMYAVREEVEILKQQIGEMMDRIGQLEYENTVLRSEAKPETLNKLLQPRLTQPQTALPSQPQSQPASMVVAPTSQQQNAPQVQPSQQQQQQQQTPMSQVGQPPSTT